MSVGLSLVIPTYNRALDLKETLENMRGLKTPEGVACELVVIDNNCTDNTAEVVEACAEQAPIPIRRVVEMSQGLCHGRNRGLQEAQYEHVLFFDDDIHIAPAWLQGYLNAVDKYGADCVVGPVNPVFKDGVPAYMTELVLESITSSYSQKGDVSKKLDTDCAPEVPGCNFGVKKAAALEIGGFDPAFDRKGNALLAGGDFDFGHRLVAAGKQVVYESSCSIEHILSKGKTDRRYLRRRWYGLGATTRLMMERRQLPVARSKRMKTFIKSMLLLGQSAGFYAAGKGAKAFERELQAWKALGFVVGPS